VSATRQCNRERGAACAQTAPVRSLRARQFAAIVTSVVASVVLSLVVAAVLVRHSVRRDALKTLSRQAELIAAQQRAGPSTGQRPASLGVFFATQQERLTIISLPQARFLLPPEGAAAVGAGRPAEGSVKVDERTYLYAARPVGQKVIVLLRSTRLEASDWRPYTLAFVIAGLAGTALAALTAFVLAAAVARPIKRVAQASRRLAVGDRPGPLPVKGSDEVASLAVAFNQMADELDRAKDAERSFLLSVSHELKTPLASIRGHGEALLEHVIDVNKASGVIIQEAKRLERLVRDLLDLARLNQRAFAVRRQTVDLSGLVKEAARRHEPEARRVGVTLVTHAAAPAPATGDPDRVLQVLSNLIENALRSTPAGGAITVTAAPGELTVADTGPGLAPEDLPRAFERFFLYGRYGKNQAAGTGLGLAIVKELTEAMDGSVTVQSRPNEGTSFFVSLPAVVGATQDAQTPA
jgi:signal transduction histidine kinase